MSENNSSIRFISDEFLMEDQEHKNNKFLPIEEKRTFSVEGAEVTSNRVLKLGSSATSSLLRTNEFHFISKLKLK